MSVFLYSGSAKKTTFSDLSIQEHVAQVQKQEQLTEREAIKLVAQLRGQPKRSVYNQIKC